MASFWARFPFAYHVFPLHAAKGIWANGLMSKAMLEAQGIGMRRQTTYAVDTLLGFHDLIHFYLPEQQDVDVYPLPILRAQMNEATLPPFPHAVLVLSTRTLRDEDCTICNFNIAVSRPAYANVRGGNHARGMAPVDILGHWQRFRLDDPDDDRRRRCEWNDPMHVPTLRGSQITDGAAAVGYNAPKQKAKDGQNVSVPELLLRSPFVPTAIAERSTIHVFSEGDRRSLVMLGSPPDWMTIQLHNAFSWYAETDRVPTVIRSAIDSYFQKRGRLPHLDFDARRH